MKVSIACFCLYPVTCLLSGSGESVIPPVGSAVWLAPPVTGLLPWGARAGRAQGWSTLAKLFHLLCPKQKRQLLLFTH